MTVMNPAALRGHAAANRLQTLLLIGALFTIGGLALLAQLGLSRVREFDADLAAARLTGDPQGLASALAKIDRVSRNWRAWLLPGWGNPEPSWLRTHPETEERIRRLLALGLPAPPDSWPAAAFTPGLAHDRGAPRWYPGGVWR